MAEVGEEAREFSLLSDENQPVSLANLNDGAQVFLLFFDDETFASLAELNDEVAWFAAHDTQVVGISTDPPSALAGVKRSNGISFPLLSDSDGTIRHRYAGEDRAIPSAVLLDRNGIIRYARTLDMDAIKQTILEIDPENNEGSP